jgi:hypothetical protein
MSLRALTVGAVLAGCLTSRAVEAAPAARLVMVQEAALTGCVDEVELERRVVARLSYDPFSTGGGATLLVRVAQQKAALIGSVEVVDAQRVSRGTREIAIASGRCDELLEALSLSISIAIDPHAAMAESAPGEEPPPAPTTPEPAAPEPLAPEPAPPTPSAAKPAVVAGDAPATAGPEQDTDSEPKVHASSNAVYALGVQGISMVGVAPATSFGAGLQARRKSGRWALGVGARLVAGSGKVGDDTELHANVAAGEVSGCFEPGAFAYCALALVGGTWARANVELPHTDSAIFAALGARVAMTAPLSGAWSLLAYAELVGVPAPVRAQVDGDTIWSAPPLAGGFSVGVSRRFP